MTIFDALTLLCGLVLFLYGMQLMGDSLKRSAGSNLKKILNKLTGNPISGFFLGLAVTAIIQSSSATTVMVVGFVNSGTMTLMQSVSVIMGANLGAAVTFWITGLSGLGGVGSVTSALEWFKPSSWMPILALIGLLLFLIFKRGKRHDIGSVLIGFAVLMVGMEMMGDSVSGLKDSPVFQDLMLKFDNPLLGLLVGTGITALIQSSGASVGILQSLSTTGLITYRMAIPIIMGQNIGTCITAMISSVSANKDGKRSAWVHLLFNVIGSVFWLIIFVILTAIITPLATFLDNTAIGMFGIAGVHTIFKLLSIALLAPLNKLLVKLACVIVPDKESEKESFQLLDKRLYTTPSVAVDTATEVTNAMAKISVDAMIKAINLMDEYDPKVAEEIRRLEEKADIYEDELGTYLVGLSSCSLTQEDGRQVTLLLHMIEDFERISDHSVNIVESCEEMREKNIVFSAKAQKEVYTLKSAVLEILNISRNAFVSNNLAEASRVEPLEQVIDDLKDQIKANHILRLQNNECTIQLGFVLADVLTNLERVSDHCSNVAGAVLDIAQHDALDVHHLLAVVKDSEAFNEMKNQYASKYDIETFSANK